jgi:hypothetical protein
MKIILYFLLFISFSNLSYSQSGELDNVVSGDDFKQPSGLKAFNSKDVYLTVDEKPQYPGGDVALKKEVIEQIVITKQIESAEGDVMIDLLINEKGKIIGKEVIITIQSCKECELACLSALNNIKKFKPAVYSNKKVKCKLLYSVHFPINKK